MTTFSSTSSGVALVSSTTSCNSPATIIPPDAPISFTATATDICAGDLVPEITEFDCFKFTKKGKRIDKTESCVVAIDGDTIAVGAQYDDHSAHMDPGAVYIFVRSGTVWTEQQKLLASDGHATGRFGWSVAVDGDSALVGAFDNGGCQGVFAAAFHTSG